MKKVRILARFGRNKSENNTGKVAAWFYAICFEEEPEQ